MARGDRTCLVCGKNYHFCGSNCQDAKANETWRALYCSQACRTAFDILSKFVNGHISADVAFEKLSALNIEEMKLNDQFKQNWEDIKKQRTQKQAQPQPQQHQNNNVAQKKIEPFKKK